MRETWTKKQLRFNLFNTELFDRHFVFYILISWYLNVVFSFTSVTIGTMLQNKK